MKKTCTRCKSRPPVKGGTRCEECRKQHRNFIARRRAEARQNHICIDCKGELDDVKFTRCPNCRARNAAAQKRFKAREKAGGDQ